MRLGVYLKDPSITLVDSGMNSSDISRMSSGEYPPIGCVKSRQSHDWSDLPDAVSFAFAAENPKILPSLWWNLFRQTYLGS